MTTVHLPAGQRLTVVADEVSSGAVYRLGDSAGDQATLATAIAAGETKKLGPYSTPADFDVVSEAGALAHSMATPAALVTGAEGSLMVVVNGEPVWLAAGADNDVLKMVAGAPAWVTPV